MDGGAGFGDGMGGFAEMPRPLIEKLIEQVLREMLGGGALKQMVAGMLGTSPASSAVPVAVVGDVVFGTLEQAQGVPGAQQVFGKA